MVSIAQIGEDAARSERAISSLSERMGVAPGRVRRLFVDEFARLDRDATVREYLHVLTASHVQAVLRRAVARAD